MPTGGSHSGQREKHRGFFYGCSVMAIVLLTETGKLMDKKWEGASYIFPLYSVFGFIILDMLMYFWRRYKKVNHPPLIFGFKRGTTELGYRLVCLLLSTGLALASFLALDLDSKSNSYKTITELLLPLGGMILIVLAILLCPIDRSSRFFSIRCLLHSICAPLYKRFVETMRAIQGALIIAGSLQMIIGFLGLWRNFVRFLRPLSVAPYVTFTVGLFLALPPVSCTGGGVLRLERVFPSPDSLSGPHYHAVVAHDHARHGEILNFSTTGVPFFPINGSYRPTGLYYSTVKVGTPSVEFHVVFDIGSDVPWLSCSSCMDCAHSTILEFGLNFFNVSASTTARITRTALYTLGYVDGTSTSGYYVTDVLYLDALVSHPVPFTFGCSTNESGNFATMVMALDGIFGFGQGRYSVISQLSARHATPRVFSHCLRGDEGGSLVLGEAVHQRMTYSHMLPNKGDYRLDLRSISVNENLLDINPRVFASGAIVDSGTTFGFLVDEAYDPFVNAIANIVSNSSNVIMENRRYCFRISTSMFPVVILNFADGAKMLLEPKDYILTFGTYPEELSCIAFTRRRGATIMGEITLKDKIIVYDLERQQVGWVNYNCSLPFDVAYVYSGHTNTRHAIIMLNLFIILALLFGHSI